MSEETKFLIDSLVEQLSLMIMGAYGFSITEALNVVYNSQLYDKIIDIETGLYYQSALYNYQLLKQELTYGKIG